MWESGRSRGWGACPVCNRGKRASVCSQPEPFQAVHISPGIYICSILFLHCLISHMHVFVPPLPNSPLLFFFLIVLLPIFSSFLIWAFSFYCFFFSPACVFVCSPPSPLAVWKQCNSPFQRLRSSLISSTVLLHVYNQPRHSGALSPSVVCTKDQKDPRSI